MLCYKRREDIDRFLKIVKADNKKIGYVPTMGALHEGHMSLLAQSKEENEITVCSIFVNPTQFNQAEDFEKYPITTSSDLLKLSHSGCDVVFLPEVKDIYPNGTINTKKLDLGPITRVLEGAHRPGHFDGVAQVVAELLNIIGPNNLYMGQKDYQQVMVIKKLIEVAAYKVKLKICATQRESDGLAMSSRNMRLTVEERKIALMLSKTLFYVAEHFLSKGNELLVKEAIEMIEHEASIKLEYFSISSANTLEPLVDQDKNSAAIALIAAWVGKVRLIDNILLPSA